MKSKLLLLLALVLLSGCAQFEYERINEDGLAAYIKINTFMKDYDAKALTSISNKFKAIGAPGLVETTE